MSDLEDFKLGGMHNAGDPDGRRVVESKNKWAALADRIEALGLPRPIKGEKVMPLFERVVAAFEKERAKYRFQYVGDLHGTPVHLHQDPPTSAEPDEQTVAELMQQFPPSVFRKITATEYSMIESALRAAMAHPPTSEWNDAIEECCRLVSLNYPIKNEDAARAFAKELRGLKR